MTDQRRRRTSFIFSLHIIQPCNVPTGHYLISQPPCRVVSGHILDGFYPTDKCTRKKVLSETNGTTYISWALFGSYSPCSQPRPHRSYTSSERGWRDAERLQGVRVEVHVMRASSRCARGGARDELVERMLLKS
jgi:hypothetical protein